MQEFGIQIEWTMTGHNRTTTFRRKELCAWCCVCVVKRSWRIKPSCLTLRRPTSMTTWKPRSRESTRSTTWTRERARSVAFFVVSSALSHSSLAHRTFAQVMMFASHSHLHGHHMLSGCSSRLPWLFLPVLYHLYLPALPTALQLLRG